MATTTPNIGLTKPIGTEKYDLDVVNVNSDIIDTEITDAKAGSNLRIFKVKNDLTDQDNAVSRVSGDSRYIRTSTSITAFIHLVYTHATDAVARFNQVGAGKIASFLQNGVEKAYVANDGSIFSNGEKLITAGNIFGKNMIINGNKRINQRGYAGGALADGEYGYDRWKSSTGDTNIKQVIEASNIDAGEYVISWVGGGTATVGATANLSSGDSVIVPSGNLDVIVPKASTKIQLERGDKTTSFEQRPISYELFLCQRYYEVIDVATSSSRPKDGNNGYAQWSYKAEKRIIPTIVLVASTGIYHAGFSGKKQVQIYQGSAHAVIGAGTNADAEL